MPVMTSSITAESGSTRMLASTWKLPAESQCQPVETIARWESSRESRSKKASSEKHEAGEDRERRRPGHEAPRDARPDGDVEAEAEERREQHEPAVVGGVHPCRLRSSSTSSGAPRRASATISPRPTTTSAAATAITVSASTWPSLPPT